jgi:hypothetical protein
VREGRTGDHGPQEYSDILSDDALGELPLIVGGQAVNLWALIYEKSERMLAAHRPFTSVDCDVVANQDWVRDAAAKHHLKFRTFKAGQASPAVGVIYIPLSSGDTELQVLRSIRGVTRKEIELAAVQLLFNGREYRVLNPISLLKAKIANVLELNQRKRQDVRHVIILGLCVTGFITEQIRSYKKEKITARDCVEICEFAARVITSKEAARVANEYGIDFKNVIPAKELLRTNEPKFRNFVQKRLPSLGL